MADIAHWSKNATWAVDLEFRVGGTLADPGTLNATALKPDGTFESYAYPGANISRTSVGLYRVTDVGDVVGPWELEVVTTGVAAGTQRHTFVIDPRWRADYLNTNALTTIANVELMLDRVGTQGSRADEEDDSRWIGFLINAFSTEIQRWCGRQFKPLQEDINKIFDYDGSGILSLAPSEARVINSVTLYTDRAVGLQQVWTPGYTGGLRDYWPFPRAKTPESTYLWLEAPRLDYPGGQVTINADWGAGVVPDPVRYVCEAEVANAYIRATARVSTIEGELLNDVGPFALSQRSQSLLEQGGYSNRALMIA